MGSCREKATGDDRQTAVEEQNFLSVLSHDYGGTSLAPTIILILSPKELFEFLHSFASFAPAEKRSPTISSASWTTSRSAVWSTHIHRPVQSAQADIPAGCGSETFSAADSADEIWSPYRFASGFPTIESNSIVRFSGEACLKCAFARVISLSRCAFENSRHERRDCNFSTSACSFRFSFSMVLARSSEAFALLFKSATRSSDSRWSSLAASVARWPKCDSPHTPDATVRLAMPAKAISHQLLSLSNKSKPG